MKEGVAMSSYLARIERANGRLLDQVQVRVTVNEPDSGRKSWAGEFVSRSADGFQPSERFSLTLDNGQKGTASVSRTLLDSRTPDTTVIEFTGSGPLG
jgi:hypothetical protein